jgi:uncharacterized protein (DUF2336 family)
MLGSLMAETSLLSEIEDMLRRLPAAKRAVLLKAITDLFLENPRQYRPEQIKLFDSLFNQLLDESETDSAAALSRRLAPIANAPPKIMGRLALNDDITVAEPVLVRSPCVDDSILMDIARNKSQTHLLAIACRPQLPTDIVDLLIARGDEIAVRYVANNQSAQISEASAIALAERAKSDDALAELISKRADVPAHLRGASAGKTAKEAPAATNAAA